MNKIFRLVWNKARCSWTVTSELGRSHGAAKDIVRAGATALVIGAGFAAMPASADCVTVASTITCSTVGGDQTATVGAGPASNNTTVEVQPGALVSTDNNSAISLNDGAVVVVRSGSTVQNASVNGDSAHPGGIGANTIEVNNNSTVTIEQGANVFANGTAFNSEAINPLGENNTIINNGFVRSTNSAIWFQSNTGKNTVINNGTIEAGHSFTLPNAGTASVLGANGTSAVDFTNRGAVVGSLNFAGGDDFLRLYTGSSITGNINGGGGANLLTLNSDTNGAETFAPLSLSGFQTLENNSGTWLFNVALPSSGITTTTVRGGTLILGADASTYKGSMTVEKAGVLQSTAQFAPQAIQNDGLVRFAQPVDGTYGGLVSGSGGIEKTGAGVLSLTADQAFTGVTTVTAGTLQLGNAGTTGSVQGDIVNNATLTTNRSNTLNIAGLISGTGDLQQVGSGTTVLTGDNTYSGGTSVAQGTLQLGNGGTSGSIVGNVLNNGVLAFNRSDTKTFAGDISGTGSAQQIGSGTTVYTGTGTYTGGTTITQGTLALGDGGTSGSIVGNVLNNGALVLNRSDTQTFAGDISGSGSVQQLGTGTTVLTGVNTYAGPTTVSAGTLKAGAVSTLSAWSAHTVASGATLDVGGFNQSVASLTNNGIVSLQGATLGTSLTVTGAYVGNGGLLRVGTTLGDSSSATDRLVLDGGSASGNTTIQVTNIGGLGAQTTGNGIEVVAARNGATSTAGAFALAGGHVDAGAYEYTLHGADQSWYLRSETEPAVPGATVPTYRSEVPLFAALPQQLRQADLAMLGNLHQRIGDEPVAGAGAAGRNAWGRVISTGIQLRQQGTVSPASEGRLTGFQVGTDVFAGQNWRAGVYVGQLEGDLRASGFARGFWGGVGGNDLRARYLGLYGTWSNGSGFYADAVLQAGDHRYTVQPQGNLSVAGKGRSLLASIEVGQSFALDQGWTVEPQLQLIHQSIDLDNVGISGASVQQNAKSGWIARAGARVKGEISTSAGLLQPYGRLNLYRASGGTDIARFVGPAAATDIATRTGGTWGEAAAGLTWALSPVWNVYGEVGRLFAISGDARVKSGLQGSVGVKARW